MKDAYEVLYQKEADLLRVRKEVESLRMAVSLLMNDASADGPSLNDPPANDLSADDPSAAGPAQMSGKRGPSAAAEAHLEPAAATGTDGRGPISRGPGFWKSLKRRRG